MATKKQAAVDAMAIAKEMVLIAIEEGAKQNKPYVDKNGKQRPASKGIHAVRSGFNLFMQNETGMSQDEVYALVDAMVAEGTIVKQPRQGGPMLYIAGTEPEDNGAQGKADSLAELVKARLLAGK